MNIDGGDTALFIADTLGSLVGRLEITPDDFDIARESRVIERKWTAYFGEPKIDLHNSLGLDHPFAISEFVTAYSEDTKVNSLILVGEVGRPQSPRNFER